MLRGRKYCTLAVVFFFYFSPGGGKKKQLVKNKAFVYVYYCTLCQCFTHILFDTFHVASVKKAVGQIIVFVFLYLCVLNVGTMRKRCSILIIQLYQLLSYTNVRVSLQAKLMHVSRHL